MSRSSSTSCACSPGTARGASCSASVISASRSSTPSETEHASASTCGTRSTGPSPSGTAGALRRALPLLGDAFLVTYGDAYLRIDHRAVQRAFEDGALPGLMTVLENEGRWDASNAVFEEGRVTAYDKREPPAGARWIDYGLLAFESRVFDRDGPADLSDVCSELAARGELGGFAAQERFYEIGTPQALAETDAFLRGSAPGT